MTDSKNKLKLDDKILAALSRGGTVDITTVGRRTGQSRRIEIALHNIGGRLYISGMPSPRRRSWLANLDVHPDFTLHLKGATRADLAATARIIEDDAERRVVMAPIARAWRRNDLDRMVQQSPLIEVTLDGAASSSTARR